MLGIDAMSRGRPAADTIGGRRADGVAAPAGISQCVTPSDAFAVDGEDVSRATALRGPPPTRPVPVRGPFARSPPIDRFEKNLERFCRNTSRIGGLRLNRFD